MIDFLEMSVPVTAPRGPIWAQPCLSKTKVLHDGQYALVQDLHPHLPMRIFWDQRYNHTRKIQFIDVGGLNAETILGSIVSAFDVEPLELELQRVDFAVDVKIPLSWFAMNVTVDNKRRRDGWSAKDRQSRWEGTSMYFGKGSSTFRIYDKRAEMIHRGRDVAHNVLTRIEHQVRRRTLMKMELRTLGDLLQRAPELRPFDAVRFPKQAPVHTLVRRPSLMKHLAGIGLARYLDSMTKAQLQVLFGDMGWRNVKDVIDRLSPFATTDTIDVPDLALLFSSSVTKQLYEPLLEQIAA